jgi:hypothetical protein
MFLERDGSRGRAGRLIPVDPKIYTHLPYVIELDDETVQFPGVHCLPKRALLSAILGRGEAGCAGKSVLRVRTKSRKVTG